MFRHVAQGRFRHVLPDDGRGFGLVRKFRGPFDGYVHGFPSDGVPLLQDFVDPSGQTHPVGDPDIYDVPFEFPHGPSFPPGHCCDSVHEPSCFHESSNGFLDLRIDLIILFSPRFCCPDNVIVYGNSVVAHIQRTDTIPAPLDRCNQIGVYLEEPLGPGFLSTAQCPPPSNQLMVADLDTFEADLLFMTDVLEYRAPIIHANLRAGDRVGDPFECRFGGASVSVRDCAVFRPHVPVVFETPPFENQHIVCKCPNGSSYVTAVIQIDGEISISPRRSCL